MKTLLTVSSVMLAVMLGATETVPFYVCKVSGSGAYSSRQFKILWDAFRQEYSITTSGSFSPYLYTEYVLRRSSETSAGEGRAGSFFQLFYDPEKKENIQHLTGNQETWKELNKYVNEKLAMDGARRYGAGLATITVGSETSTPGTYSCTMNSAPAQDVDARDSAAQVDAGTATSIVFCDPKNHRTGRTTIYIEGHFYGNLVSRLSGGIRSSGLREVGSILDTKENQDSFVEALKAGSSFRVFWFKEITCTNCGGLGRLSTLVVNQAGGAKALSNKGYSSTFGSRNSSNGNAALSLTPGASVAADRCPACAGTGKRMRGYLSTLMWDDKGPSFDAAK